jgi:hypothetical protein
VVVDNDELARWECGPGAPPMPARTRARSLFGSLERLRQLRPEIVVLPAQTSEPIAFDGQPVAARLGDVDAWLGGWLSSESAFVDRVTSQLPPTPPNFVRIVDLNEAGDLPTGDPTDLEAGANRCAVRSLRAPRPRDDDGCRRNGSDHLRLKAANQSITTVGSSTSPGVRLALVLTTNRWPSCETS